MTDKKMSDMTLKAICQQKIEDSLAYFGGKLVQDRVKAMQYYYGQAYGNEIEGRSQVVSRDVAETVEASIPSFMRIFASGDQVVRYEPSKPGDEGAANQATDYVNWIWNQQNEGFRITHDWVKDGLLQRLGVIKIWWDTQTDIRKEHYKCLSDMQLQIIQTDPDVDVVDVMSYPDPTQPIPVQQPQTQAPPSIVPPPPQPMLHDVTVRRKQKKGRVRIMNVPPDEFLREHRSISLDDANFTAHRVRKSISDLIEMGYPRDVVENIPSDEEEYNQERLERFAQEDQLPYREVNEYDKSLRYVWITECYLRVDYDGDGIAEMRKVTVAGNSHTILDNEEVDNHPFAAWTPIMMPHKLEGESLADFTMDLQLIKSTLWRQSLDNMYLTNNSRVVVLENQVYLDDLLNARPGGVIREKVPGAVRPFEVQEIAGSAMQMIEYVDQVAEKRTGISAYNQGLDADALNKTAAGISMIQEAGNQRLELMARVFAETGLKQAFKRILELVCQYQDKAETIRLRGKWIDMDPREWSDQYGVSIDVGLGTGNKRGAAQNMQMLLQLDQQIIQLQGGVNGPILTLQNIYEKLARLTESVGYRNVDTYYTDPGNQPYNPPQKQDPKIQQEQQLAAAKMQIEQVKANASMETERMRAQSGMAIEQMKAEHEMHLNAFKAINP